MCFMVDVNNIRHLDITRNRLYSESERGMSSCATIYFLHVAKLKEVLYKYGVCKFMGT